MVRACAVGLHGGCSELESVLISYGSVLLKCSGACQLCQLLNCYAETCLVRSGWRHCKLACGHCICHAQFKRCQLALFGRLFYVSAAWDAGSAV